MRAAALSGPASVVFNDGHGRQTGKLRRERSGWYDGSRWSEQQSVAAPAPTAAGLLSAAENFGDAMPQPPNWSKNGSPGPNFSKETIYFLITTRFYNGDPSNNFLCCDRIKSGCGGELEDPHRRDDFKGLIERFDYIRDLDFTAIWITPPVENRSGLDYHGYHPYDWTRGRSAPGVSGLSRPCRRRR